MEYISCNMGTCDLPEIYTLALGLRPRARVYISAPSCSCVYFRQITRAHVTTTTYILDNETKLSIK